MQLEGRVWKDGKFWLAEIPALDYVTQGHTKNEALSMAKNIVRTGVDKTGFKVSLKELEGNTFFIETNDPVALLAHMLKRLRQKNGLSVREASKRLGSSSPNAFGVYEQGRVAPTIGKLEELLKALHRQTTLTLKVA